jgi:NAD(P)-dependent dehydrogenase (short-subunit alcohol dehydrogenase family)
MREQSQVLDRFRLDNRVALVTGGSRGLGFAMAEAFAHAGADVVIASRKADRCREVADRLSTETGRRVVGYGCHVGRWEELPELVDAVYDSFGRLDVLVNNAGISPTYDRLTDVSEKMWDSVFAVNVKGPFRLSVLAADRMYSGDGGSIINISSTASMRPRADIVPYASAKAGLNAVTLGLVHAFAPSVRANSIVAGPFLTDISAGWPEEKIQSRAAALAVKRLGHPDDIVGAALYLASDASAYTTGALLEVGGGYAY